MLPKRSRLSAGEVRAVLAKGASYKVGSYGGKYLPGREPLGIAVIVSKREAKSAVERNRLRRAAYRDIEGLTLPASGSLALFVRAARQR